MKKKLVVLTVGVALQLCAGLASADPNKPGAASALPAKQCYLFNPRNFDQQWTVSCEPQVVKATKMCRINSASGFDAAQFTTPCEPQTGQPMKMCRVFDIPGFDAAQFTEPCENAERRKGLSGR